MKIMTMDILLSAFSPYPTLQITHSFSFSYGMAFFPFFSSILHVLKLEATLQNSILTEVVHSHISNPMTSSGFNRRHFPGHFSGCKKRSIPLGLDFYITVICRGKRKLQDLAQVPSFSRKLPPVFLP